MALFFGMTLLVVPITVLPTPVFAEDEISDPFERWNRGIFWFNNKVDRYIFEPVAEGYDSVMPDALQSCVGNFFSNVQYPSHLLSDVVQLKFSQAARHTGRFVINTTLGLGGLFDMAKHMGLEEHKEDFGTALAHHGVPAGPYIVVPILGPTTFRDGFGDLVDNLIDPISVVPYSTADDSDAFLISGGLRGIDAVQTRADLLDAVDAAKDASVDYYLFIQSAYYQHRNNVINDRATKSDEEADPFAEDEAFDAEFEAAE